MINRGKYIASSLMIAVGLMLILVNTLGLVLKPNFVGEIATFANSEFKTPVNDTLMLQELLREPVSRFDLESVNSMIFESLTHSDQRKIQIYENWILWLAGKFYDPLSRTQNPERIVSGGGGDCSEMSAVLNNIARLNGFQTRFVGLNGHVVSEIRTANGWRVSDPDYGVTYPVGLEILENRQGFPLIRELLKNRGYNEETINRYILFFQSEEDNIVTDINVAISPRLYAIEIVSDWLKWLVPIILIIPGFRKRGSVNTVSAGSSSGFSA